MKRSKGLTWLGVILILTGGWSLVSFLFQLSPAVKGTYIPWSAPIFASTYFISCVGILLLKSWARWVAIACSLYFVIITPVRIMIGLLCALE